MMNIIVGVGFVVLGIVVLLHTYNFRFQNYISGNLKGYLGGVGFIVVGVLMIIGYFGKIF